jgi:hypothetical protein
MANRFWVGGTDTWNSTAGSKWSTTSGGAGGASVPGAADIAIFDTASGAVTVSTDATTATVTGIQITGASVVLSLGAAVTATGTFTFTAGAIVLNNNQLNCGVFSSNNSNTRSIAFGTGNITVTGNSATVWNTATATGFSYTGTSNVNFTYAGGSGTRVIAQGNFTAGGTEANSLNMNISAGTDTVNFGGAGRGYRNLDFTGFAGTFTNTAVRFYGNLTFSAGMTLAAGTATVSFAGTGVQTIITNGQTLDFPMLFDGVGGTVVFDDALTQGAAKLFTITNGTIKLKAGVTSTVGDLATSGTNQKFLQSTVAGSQATLSQASGTVSVSYLTIKDINATGGATWNAFVTNNNVDAGNNTGWDFFTQAGKYIYTRRKNKRILL